MCIRFRTSMIYTYLKYCIFYAFLALKFCSISLSVLKTEKHFYCYLLVSDNALIYIKFLQHWSSVCIMSGILEVIKQTKYSVGKESEECFSKGFMIATEFAHKVKLKSEKVEEKC